MSRSDRNGRRPTVESVEPRTLLSAITDILALNSLAAGRRAATGSLPNNIGPPTAGNTPVDNNLLLFPKGQPSAHQLKKERFDATFEGPFSVGRGAYSTEASQVYIRGAGGSNQFLHGDAQLRVIVPADNTKPLGGEITMFDRNLNSNSALGLDLTGSAVTDVDRFGRPTHLIISQLDPNVSSGVYVEGEASGTVTIKYLPSNKGSRQGNAIITIRARVYSIGTSFILTNADINPGGPSTGPKAR